MNKKEAWFYLDSTILKDILQLPKCEIIGCEWDFIHKRIKLFIQSDDLKPVEEGGSVPFICPFVSRVGTKKTALLNWTWYPYEKSDKTDNNTLKNLITTLKEEIDFNQKKIENIKSYLEGKENEQ